MYDDIIESASKQYAVNVNLVRAVIKTESDWNPFAYRKEPQINDTSWGLMQILLGTAKGVSNNNNLTAKQLLDPSVNILIGTKYLSQLSKKYNNMNDVISAYNGGRPLRSKTGFGYVNQDYVDKVNKWYMYYSSNLFTVSFILLIGGLMYFTSKK